MSRLTLFGLFAVTAMLVTYALENRSRWFILAFSGACVLGSIYGFLQGAWPFGIVEGICGGAAALVAGTSILTDPSRTGAYIFREVSFSKSILKSSIEVSSTTIAEPATPATNITSIMRIRMAIKMFINSPFPRHINPPRVKKLWSGR